MHQLPVKPKLHVFICVNDRSQRHTPTASCAPTINLENFKEIKRWIVANGWAATVYCTKVQCLGFCNPDGGVICIYPSGKYFKGITKTDDIKQLILEELRLS